MSLGDFDPLHRILLYLPVVTTLVAALFCFELFRRYRSKGGGPHLLWWGQLLGLLLIFAGYRKCVQAPLPAIAPARAATAGAATLVLLLAAAPALAVPQADADGPPATQKEGAEADSEQGEASFYARTTVTATGYEVDTFEVAPAVTVIPAEEIAERMPENAADLLREEPGVDVNGVGSNQQRPIIRGQRGLRVLFLADGLRMNNARRQTDFGEISGLIDLEGVEAVEVVRGPASVLYGSDAIGGVLNLISRKPGLSGERLTGSAGARYRSAGDGRRLSAGLGGRADRWSWDLGFTTREGDDYQAPAGRYGEVELSGETTVIDTGIEDESAHGAVAFDLADGHELALRGERYRAEQAGFGLVEPAALGVADPFRIRILYPFQDFDRFSLRYVGSALESPLADSIELKAYHQSNERRLVNDIDDIIIGPLFPGAPPSSVDADTDNFTDLDTFGLRAEVIKLVGENHLVTYGVEGSEDDSFNTDFSTTTVFLRFPFPPFEIRDVSTDDVANAPNATNVSYGVFVQDEISAGERLKITAGARYQVVETRAEPTPGWDIAGLDFDDDSLVGSLNLLYRVNDNLNLVGAYGTAFRAPNIIERLFNGPTPEGIGFQLLNPQLASEQSDNVDLGLKYRRRNAYLEVIAFRTEIEDGIVQDFLSPAEIAALPQAVQDEITASGASFVVRQENADRLRYEGVEASIGYRSLRGWSAGANYTWIDAERIDSTQPPTGDTYEQKLNAHLRYQRPRWWAEYRLRHHGDADASLDPDEPAPPAGRVLPSFTVHALAGAVTLFERGRQRHVLGLEVENLTDELYAEFSNVSFFRPQPERSVVASYRLRF